VRTIGASLLAHYQSGSTTLAWGLKITRTDAEVYGFTSAQEDAEISGVDYVAAPGLDVASLSSAASFAVENTELRILSDDVLITTVDLLAGRWDNADFELFRYNWADLTMGRDVHMVGKLGQVQPRGDYFVVELRGLQFYLQQSIGAASTKTCRARFADFPAPISTTVRCRLVAADFTETGAVTGVTSKQAFADSSRTEADDWFGEGVLTWLTGNNAGLSQKVKTYTLSGGAFVLSLPMIATIQVGDTYSVVAGCRKRLDEDCVTKFDNVLNFQGEPHRPTLDEVTESPEVSV
jgi:uncharacterized phage protein (TIGR02218 family)